jgi:putative flippase GtrA
VIFAGIYREIKADKRFRFVIIGGVNTFFGFVLFTGFYALFHKNTHYLFIFLISQIWAVIFSHFTQRNYVWESDKRYFSELAKFSTSYGIVSFLNIILLATAVELLDFPVLISQYLIGFCLTISSYFIQKYFVFRNIS